MIAPLEYLHRCAGVCAQNDHHKSGHKRLDDPESLRYPGLEKHEALE